MPFISPLECLRIKFGCQKSRHPATDYCTHVLATPSTVIQEAGSQLMGCLVRLPLRILQAYNYVCELLITFNFPHSSRWVSARNWTSGQVKTGLCQERKSFPWRALALSPHTTFDWTASALLRGGSAVPADRHLDTAWSEPRPFSSKSFPIHFH